MTIQIYCATITELRKILHDASNESHYRLVAARELKSRIRTLSRRCKSH